MDCISGLPLVHIRWWETFSSAGVIGLMRKKRICSCLNLNSWLIQILSLGVTKGCWSLLTSQTRFSILMEMPSCHVHANADSQGLVAILCCEKDCEDVLSSQRFITTPDIFITWAWTFAGSFQLFGLSSPTAGTLGFVGACCFAYADGLDLWPSQEQLCSGLWPPTSSFSFGMPEGVYQRELLHQVQDLFRETDQPATLAYRLELWAQFCDHRDSGMASRSGGGFIVLMHYLILLLAFLNLLLALRLPRFCFCGLQAQLWTVWHLAFETESEGQTVVTEIREGHAGRAFFKTWNLPRDIGLICFIKSIPFRFLQLMWTVVNFTLMPPSLGWESQNGRLAMQCCSQKSSMRLWSKCQMSLCLSRAIWLSNTALFRKQRLFMRSYSTTGLQLERRGPLLTTTPGAELLHFFRLTFHDSTWSLVQFSLTNGLVHWSDTSPMQLGVLM